jgi:hypothetical protein
MASTVQDPNAWIRDAWDAAWGIRKSNNPNTVIANTPVGPKEVGGGSKQGDLVINSVGNAVGKFYPEWAKKDLRATGYVVDDAPLGQRTSARA